MSGCRGREQSVRARNNSLSIENDARLTGTKALRLSPLTGCPVANRREHPRGASFLRFSAGHQISSNIDALTFSTERNVCYAA